MNILKGILHGIWEIIESTTVALALTMVVYLFLFQPGQVYGTSSYPTWKDGERFITDKITYHFVPPERGDFVVLQSPSDPDIEFIKRIIGLPGERVKISGGQVFINGSVLHEPYLDPGTSTGPESFLSEGQVISLKPGYYFLMGDNRLHSSDSRDFGPIPESSIIGRVVFRFWPPDRFGPIAQTP